MRRMAISLRSVNVSKAFSIAEICVSEDEFWSKSEAPGAVDLTGVDDEEILLVLLVNVADPCQ